MLSRCVKETIGHCDNGPSFRGKSQHILHRFTVARLALCAASIFLGADAEHGWSSSFKIDRFSYQNETGILLPMIQWHRPPKTPSAIPTRKLTALLPRLHLRPSRPHRRCNLPPRSCRTVGRRTSRSSDFHISQRDGDLLPMFQARIGRKTPSSKPSVNFRVEGRFRKSRASCSPPSPLTPRPLRRCILKTPGQ